jgi:hypothetical protein
MVPVLDKNNIPLMPCSEKRARQMMEKGKAKAYWQKNIFCIKLCVEPSARNYQDIYLGLDPGSKREGYTVLTGKSVVMNITTDTKGWVKDHVETRRNLRRSRRQRKTPYRICKSNRLRNRNHIPPSTKTRWNTKLQMIKYLLSILPITTINVEDIQAITLKGKAKIGLKSLNNFLEIQKNKDFNRKWNTSFSPLEVGKNWFYSEIQKSGINLILTQGYDTKTARDLRGFSKSKKKLDWIWEAHNVDSHVLAELALKKQVQPYKGMWKVEFLEYHRRVLHVQNPIKGNVRKSYGGTISMGISKGSIARYKGNLCYVGGTSKNRISIHDVLSGVRITQSAKKEDISVLYTNNRRVQFLPCL